MLVAGSFAPDMTYYAASVVSGAMEFGDVTHAGWGVFTVDVVIAWALVGLWLLVREPLVALLPRVRQGRVAALTRCGAPRERVRASLVARWYLSAVLGGLTHVVWDAFTHHDRWGTRLIPVLGEEIGGSPVFWYAQYGSSLLAAVVLVVFTVRALRRTVPGARCPRGCRCCRRATGGRPSRCSPGARWPRRSRGPLGGGPTGGTWRSPTS